MRHFSSGKTIIRSVTPHFSSGNNTHPALQPTSAHHQLQHITDNVSTKSEMYRILIMHNVQVRSYRL